MNPYSNLKIKHPIYYCMAAYLSLSLATTSCIATPNDKSSECLTLKINNKTVCLEVADDDKSMNKGLMKRSELKNNNGMLFIWKHARKSCMWMKNTWINLDVAFITEGFTIDSIYSMTANTLNTHCSEKEINYAIEMNQGWFKDNDISKGQSINLAPILSSISDKKQAKTSSQVDKQVSDI